MVANKKIKSDADGKHIFGITKRPLSLPKTRYFRSNAYIFPVTSCNKLLFVV